MYLFFFFVLFRANISASWWFLWFSILFVDLLLCSSIQIVCVTSYMIIQFSVFFLQIFPSIQFVQLQMRATKQNGCGVLSWLIWKFGVDGLFLNLCDHNLNAVKWVSSIRMLSTCVCRHCCVLFNRRRKNERKKDRKRAISYWFCVNALLQCWFLKMVKSVCICEWFSFVNDFLLESGHAILRIPITIADID